MRRRTLLLFLLTAFCVSGMAQAAYTSDISKEDIDSLLAVYEKMPGRKKQTLAPEIIQKCLANDEIVNTLPAVKPGMPADSIDLLVWFAADRFYYNNSYFSEALTYINRALTLSPKNNNDIHATLLADKAYNQYKAGQTAQATETVLQAEHYAKKKNNLLQLSRAYLYLSIINGHQKLYDTSIEYVEKAIATNNKLGLNNNTHNAYGIACEIYGFANDFKTAVDYGWKAVDAAKAIGSVSGEANHLAQLSYAYNRQGDYAKGIEVAEQAIELIKHMSIPDREMLAMAMVYKSHSLIDSEQYEKAADELRRAIAIQEEIGNTRAVCSNHFALYQALAPYDEHGALQALYKYARMTDSLHAVDLKEELGKANAEFKNSELQAEKDLQVRQNHIILATAVSLTLLLLATIAVLAYGFRLRSRSLKATRDLQNARDTFFTNITHEFRTPLTVILGLSQKLRKAHSNDIGEVHIAANIIESEGDSLLQLINQLLDFSKVKANVSDHNWRTGNIISYLNMLLESYQHLANAKGIDVSFAARENDVEMDFSPDLIRKILGNLVSNAIKFTPEYGRVYITTSADGRRLTLTVADSGRGIDREDIDHIFEPFFQGNTSEMEMGTGVGLSLVKQIVDSLQGTIEVVSSKGKGSVFTITLPLKHGKSDWPRFEGNDAFRSQETGEKSLDTEPEIQDSSDETDECRQSILIVEDNKDVAYYIGNQLEQNYELFYANNGRVGLEKAKNIVPDLVITDLMMPEVDGLELCREIRQSDVLNHIPIIIISAKSTEEERIKGIEAGADAYIFKPFNSEELSMRVTKLLEQRRLLRDKFSNTMADSQSSGQSLSEADSIFLGKVTDIVYAQMQKGNVDIDSVASTLCMTPSQFRRKFTTITGQTPAPYILKIRIANAQRLLDKHPEWTIAEVAEKCGFSDGAHFSHAFKKLTNLTPSQYVKRAR